MATASCCCCCRRKETGANVTVERTVSSKMSAVLILTDRRLLLFHELNEKWVKGVCGNNNIFGTFATSTIHRPYRA